jgi:hypothetical protein
LCQRLQLACIDAGITIQIAPDAQLPEIGVQRINLAIAIAVLQYSRNCDSNLAGYCRWFLLLRHTFSFTKIAI